MTTGDPTDAHHDWILAVSGKDPRDYEAGRAADQIGAAKQARLTTRLAPLAQRAAMMDAATKSLARTAIVAVKANDPTAMAKIATLEAAVAAAAAAASQDPAETASRPATRIATNSATALAAAGLAGSLGEASAVGDAAPSTPPATASGGDSSLFADLLAAKPGLNPSVLHKRISARFALDPIAAGEAHRILGDLTDPDMQVALDRAAAVGELRRCFPGEKTPEEKTADDRIIKAIEMAGEKLGPAVGSKLKTLASSESVAIIVTFVGLFVLAQLTPLGWFADAVAFLASATLAAVELQVVIDDVRAFLSLARNPNGDLDAAAEHLAHAVAAIGVDLVVAILLHKSGGAAKPYVKPPSGYVEMITPDGMIVRVPEDVAKGRGGGAASDGMAIEGDPERGGATDEASDDQAADSNALPLDNAKAVADRALDSSNGGKPLEGYKGGQSFKNDGRGGGQQLPVNDPQGRPILYKEWDVRPLEKGSNRGAERVVTGSDGTAYYTADHYKTFTKIK